MMVKYERVRFRDWQMPDYTKGEEIFNMVSHIVGAAFGIVALVLSVVFSALKGDVWSIVGSSVYGATMILLYTVSSVYHGLGMNMGKRVMQQAPIHPSCSAPSATILRRGAGDCSAPCGDVPLWASPSSPLI